MIIALVVLMNLGCSLLCWGLTLGSFTKQFPYMKNTDVAAFFAMFGLIAGPLALLGVLICSLSQGFPFRMKPLTTEERFQIFNRNYSSLGREYFDKNIG